MVDRIYPDELQLNKVNLSDTDEPFLGFHHPYLMVQFLKDLRDNFDFDSVNVPSDIVVSDGSVSVVVPYCYFCCGSLLLLLLWYLTVTSFVTFSCCLY